MSERLTAVLDAARRVAEEYAKLRTEAGSPWLDTACSDLALALSRLPEDPAESLDQAWKAACAAMPKGWRFSVVPYWPKSYEAEAHDLRKPDTPGRGKYSTGTTGPFDTPAAALRELVRLVSTLPEEPSE